MFSDPVSYLIHKIPPKIRPFFPILGGILTFLTFGTIYTAGNVTPYMASYLRAYVDPGINTNIMVWIFTMQMNFPPLFVAVGGWMEHKLGARITASLGSVIMSIGVILTYITIKQSYFLTLLTYGMVFGLGRSLVFGPPIVVAMKWLPSNKGMATGLVCLGLGGGGLIFAPIQTKFVNPWNYQPNSEGYFTQPDLLANVPKLFLMLGCVYLVLQFFGCLLLIDPKENDSDKESSTEDTDEQTPLFGQRNRTLTDTYTIPIPSVLKSGTFWWLFLSLGLNAPVLNMVSSFYKSFGQTFIYDDIFLALVGSFGSAFNAFGRLFWGFFADEFSYQVAMGCSVMLQAFLMFTFELSKYSGKAFYFIWVCLLNLGFASNFTLYPLACAKCFGSQNMALNYGFLTLGLYISSCLISGVADQLLMAVGYTGLWFICGALLILTFILTVTIQLTDYGKGISSMIRKASRIDHVRRLTLSY